MISFQLSITLIFSCRSVNIMDGAPLWKVLHFSINRTKPERMFFFVIIQIKQYQAHPSRILLYQNKVPFDISDMFYCTSRWGFSLIHPKTKCKNNVITHRICIFPHYLISQRHHHTNHFWTAQHPPLMGKSGVGGQDQPGPAWCSGSTQSPRLMLAES